MAVSPLGVIRWAIARPKALDEVVPERILPVGDFVAKAMGALSVNQHLATVGRALAAPLGRRSGRPRSGP